MVEKIERAPGKGGIYLTCKLFGIILLLISVKLFTSNIYVIFDKFD